MRRLQLLRVLDGVRQRVGAAPTMRQMPGERRLASASAPRVARPLQSGPV